MQVVYAIVYYRACIIQLIEPMTQAEIEAKAKVAAVDIIEWCCMTEGERDEKDSNFISHTIAGLMHEAYEAGQQESDYLEGFDNGYKAGATDQHKIDIEEAVKWLDNNINNYLFNDNSNGKYRDWLKCSSQAFVDFRKAMEYEESN